MPEVEDEPRLVASVYQEGARDVGQPRGWAPCARGAAAFRFEREEGALGPREMRDPLEKGRRGSLRAPADADTLR